jgi:N-acyl-D-amino-acid deacylase
LWTPVPFGGRREEPFAWGQLDPAQAEITRGWRRFRDWIDWLSAQGVSVNFGSFVGGATLREYAMGWDAEEPNEDELKTMRCVMAEAMEDGAFGVATALIYPPNAFSTPRELTEVARVVSEYGGLYITHIRSEGDRLLEGLEEAIELGRAANVPVEIYHLKATGEQNWPKMAEVIARIDRARGEGIDVAADMYPYIFSGTGLTVLLPDWASEGGRLYERLEHPETRARIRADMVGPDVEALTSAKNPRRDYVYPLGFRKPENRQYIGKHLEEIAALRGQEWPDAAIDLILEERQWISTLFVIMSEENLKLQLRQPWIKISTDASGMDPAGQENPVHPRAYGTYTRVLAKYVREEKVLSLEGAVRIMSSAVADRLGLRDRGQIREGFFADVILFDPATVRDHATFTDTHQLSTGIRDVWVNGARVLKEGEHTGAMPGRAVYGAGRR